jgi:hypothetical protein
MARLAPHSLIAKIASTANLGKTPLLGALTMLAMLAMN